MHALVRELRNKEFYNAERIYKEGGHTGSYAVLHLDEALTTSIPAGTLVQGPTPFDAQSGARGFVREDVESGQRSMIVDYKVTEDLQDHQQCQIGALQSTYSVGCFNATGTLNVGGRSVTYHYDFDTENKNSRNIADMNQHVKDWTDTPYSFLFREYFGSADYLVRHFQSIHFPPTNIRG